MTMRIFVLNISGENLATLNADASTTVLELKGNLKESLSGVAVGRQKLLYQDAILQNGQSLLDIGISDGAQLTLVVGASYRALTSSCDKTAKLWNLDTGECVLTLQGHGSQVRTAVFSPDGCYALTAGDDRRAMIWNLETGKPTSTLAGHMDYARFASYSPDGQLVITASNDNTAKIWNSTTGACVLDFKEHSSDVLCARFTPDGGRALTASVDRTAKLWDVATGTVSITFVGDSPMLSGAVSPDGSLILTTFSSLGALWNAETGAKQCQLAGHNNMVRSCQFHPDGLSALTCSDDCSARMWSVKTGECLRSFSGQHKGLLCSVEFSSDGSRLLTSSFDHTAAVWHTETGEVEKTLEGHVDRLLYAAFEV